MHGLKFTGCVILECYVASQSLGFLIHKIKEITIPMSQNTDNYSYSWKETATVSDVCQTPMHINYYH